MNYWQVYRHQLYQLSRVMRKKMLLACAKTKAQISCAVAGLCLRYTDSTLPHFPNSKIARLLPTYVAVHPGWYRTRSETLNTDFVVTRLSWQVVNTSAGLTAVHIEIYMIATFWIRIIFINLFNIKYYKRLYINQKK